MTPDYQFILDKCVSFGWSYSFSEIFVAVAFCIICLSFYVLCFGFFEYLFKRLFRKHLLFIFNDGTCLYYCGFLPFVIRKVKKKYKCKLPCIIKVFKSFDYLQLYLFNKNLKSYYKEVYL